MTDKAKTAAIRAKLKYPTVEAFITGYAQNISKYGIFFKTTKPRSVGTPVKFELKLGDDTIVMRGLGEVAWNREAADGTMPAGMGIKFLKLDANSKDTIRKVLVHKKQGDITGHSRYSEVPPAADGGEVEEAQPEMAATPEPVPEASPAAAAESAPEPAGEPAPDAPVRRKVKKKKKRDVSLGDVDSMLANIASGKKKRRKKVKKSTEEAVAEAVAADADKDAAQAAQEAEAAAKAAAEEKAAAAEAARKAAEEEAARKVAEEEARKAAEEAAAKAAEEKRLAEEAAAAAEEEAERVAAEEAARKAEAERVAAEEAAREAEEASRRAEAERIAAEAAAEEAVDEEALQEERAKVAQDRLRAEQEAAKIEADEGEIDDVIAAFDAIQMPGEEPAVVEKPATPPPRPPSAKSSAPPPMPPEKRDSIIDDLINEEVGDGGLMDELEPESLDVTGSVADLEIEPETTEEEEEATREISTGPHGDGTEFDMDALGDDEDDDAPFFLDDDEMDASDVIGEDGDDEPLFDSDDSGFLDADEYIISESTEDMDIEMSTALSADVIGDIVLDGADDILEDDIEEIEDSAELITGEDRIAEVVEDLSRDSMPPEEEVPADDGATYDLSDMFDDAPPQERPLSPREQQLDRVAAAPDTLPDDALPDSVAEILERKSMAPPPVETVPEPAPAWPTDDDDLAGPGDVADGGKKKKGFFKKMFGK